MTNVIVINSLTRGISIFRDSESAAPVVIFNGVHANNNGDFGLTVDGRGTAFAPTGFITGCNFSGNNGTSTSPNVRAVNNGAWTNIEFRACTPIEAQSLNHVGGHETIGDPGRNVSTFGEPHKNQRLLVKMPAGASRTFFDKSDGSGHNLNLAGGENFVMTENSRLLLAYEADLDEWFEISRSVN